jgi:SPFH domain / Band 7 family
MPTRMPQMILGGAIGLIGLIGAVYWGVFRIYVPPDKCVVLIRKSGTALPEGTKIAGPGQKGIQAETLGPGRYFLNPLTWETELHDLVTISAGDPNTWRVEEDISASDYQHAKLTGKWPEVGVLVNRVGKPNAKGDLSEIVGEGEQGIQARVLTPGVYRINPYVYEVKRFPATVIPTGYAGVVTSMVGTDPGATSAPAGSQPASTHFRGALADAGQRGVLRDVLQPGIYYLNPLAHRVQVIWVGYNLMSQLKSTDATEQISFPSMDGFTIDIDVTVVWGLHPAHTPAMISGIGEADRIRQIILSQLRSICRNVGSNFSSTDFIQGERREAYQKQVTEALRRVCADRDIELLIALIQNLEVHGGSETKVTDSDLKRTIQRGFIAREQDLTNQKKRETAKVLADLEAAKAEVPVSRERVTSDTRLKVAEAKALGRKKAEEIDAQRDLEVAQVERQIAELDAETKRQLGKAEARSAERMNSADADGRRLMIEAFGSGRAYNLFTFAENFAPERITLFYAGDGTFWTDLTRMQDAAALEVLQSKGAEPPPPPQKKP